jgi:hypothetical protein
MFSNIVEREEEKSPIPADKSPRNHFSEKPKTLFNASAALK